MLVKLSLNYPDLDFDIEFDSASFAFHFRLVFNLGLLCYLAFVTNYISLSERKSLRGIKIKTLMNTSNVISIVEGPPETT